MKKIKSIGLTNVTLKDSYYLNAFSKERDYLLALDTDRMLAGFRENAGLDMKEAQRYEGWEDSLIGGHTFGHYLTALVQAYQSATTHETDRKEILSKLHYIKDTIKECQDAIGSGFIFAAKILDGDIEKQFDNVEELKGEIFTQAWVPWYTMHKIIAGLVSLATITHDFCDEKGLLGTDSRIDQREYDEIKAMAKETTEILSKLGDWVYKRVTSWDDVKRNNLFIIEYGGMNDCMYDLYLLTGKEEHLIAAHYFDEDALFEKVYNSKSGEDVLANVHANTTIPKYLGAIKRYMVTGEEKYLRYVEKFWNYVIEDHTYITGGNSEWEHFRKDRKLNEVRTNCNCETCNVYNFIKLSKALFMITGDCKYLDVYENAFINQILSSQNPESGMTTYFQPMASGYFKVYSTRFTKFWCCTGSGMENFSKLGDSLYYSKEGNLIIASYVSSKVFLNNTGFEIVADLLHSNEVKISILNDFDKDLYLRLPNWLAGPVRIISDNKETEYENVTLKTAEARFARVKGPFKRGSEIHLLLPMKIRAYNLPDAQNVYGFKYGPYVLSAKLGNKDMVESSTGVNVTIPKEKIFEKKYIPSESELVKVTSEEVTSFMEKIDEYMEKDFSKEIPEFTLKGTDSNLVYVPHYTQYRQRYAIYLRFE